MIEHIIIFGATGDLTARYLLPALAHLYEADELPDGIKITGVEQVSFVADRNRRAL